MEDNTQLKKVKNELLKMCQMVDYINKSLPRCYGILETILEINNKENTKLLDK